MLANMLVVLACLPLVLAWTAEVFNGTHRISPYSAPATGGCSGAMTLSAAGREHESFQVAVRGEVNSTLYVSTHGTESSFSASWLTFHQVGFVWVTNATDTQRTYGFDCPPEQLQRMGGCWVADPLLPIQNGSTGTLRAVANLTMALWITVKVPSKATAGFYNRSVQIKTSAAAGSTIFEVHVCLRVRKISLPLAPALKNTIQLDAAHLHRSFPSFGMNETRTLFRQYARWTLSEFRLNPGSIYDTWTSGHFREYNSPFLLTPQDIDVLVREEGMNAITLPCAPLNLSTQFVQQLVALNNSTAALVSCYAFDEYNGPMSPAIPALFGPVRTALPSALTLTTAHIGMQYEGLVKEPVPFTAESLKRLQIGGACPATNYLPPKANISEVQAAGGQVWTYISMQPYKPYPDWRLDNHIIDCRVLFWMVRAFGLDGLLHWGLNQWSGLSGMAPIPKMRSDWPTIGPSSATSQTGIQTTVPTLDRRTPAAGAARTKEEEGLERGLPFLAVSQWNPASYGDGSGLNWLFGDGKLLYTGTNGPIGSIRLANIRDGMEDYDYLALASAVDAAATSAVNHRINDGERPYVVARDAAALAAAREELAQIIERR
jgi:hypothetical protein